MHAAIYARISEDPEGLAVGVARQLEDSRALARSKGLTVLEEYVDNDLGASTRSRKPRPGYQAMLAAVRRSEVAYIVSYSSSRLTRRPMENEELIQLYERLGVRYLTCVSGEDDLSTADGRMIARVKAAVDAAEAERTGERVARAKLGSAMSGRQVSSGKRPFGWNRDGSLHPVEGPALKKAASEVLAGRVRYSICKEWNEAGLLTTGGKLWRTSVLTNVLKAPRMAGLVTYRGKPLLDEAGRPIRGDMEPTLGQDTWEALTALLGASEGLPRASRRYLCTGILRCSTCTGPLYGNLRNDKLRYMCNVKPDHNTTISGKQVDRLVGDLVVARLQQEDLPEVDIPWGKEEALREVEERLQAVMHDFNQGAKNLPPDIAFQLMRDLSEKRDGMRKDRARWQLATSGPVLPSVTPEEWERMNLEGQARIIRMLLDAVVVYPAKRREFDPERLRPIWRR